MNDHEVMDALARLRAAADRVRLGWPDMRWTRLSGPGPDTLVLNAAGVFAGLHLEPGRELALRCTLEVPAEAAGVSLVGDPLELTIWSLYPIDVSWNETPLFADSGVPVAAGPALVTVLPELTAGDNGTLEARVRPPNNQTRPWAHLRFTTPGLRRRFELLDAAWAELALAEALAASDAERRLLVRAAALIDALVDATDSKALAQLLAQLEAELAPLAERAAELHVHVIGHSHIDMNWLWTWPDTVEVIRRDMSSVLALMDDYGELTFSHSQPATYEVLRQHEPALFARIVEHISSGRWEAATMTWVEGDTNMASGEAHARQLVEGVRYTREVLGATPDVFMAPDTFGHAGNLPQLAASAGARYYYHHRANPGQADYWPAYWWHGQDGSRLLAMSTHTYNGEITARDLVEATLHARHHGHAEALHFHGIGDHGGGPARHNLDLLRGLRARPLLPRATCSTLGAYARAVLQGGGPLPTVAGESSTIFEGCYTTHADTKAFNRQGENLLTTADTLAALAGQDHSPALQSAWRTVLFNQFHDILDGSAIHETYVDQAREHATVVAAADDVIDRALAALQADTPASCIAITNPLGWEREEWVALPDATHTAPVWLAGSHGHRTIGQPGVDGLGFVARVGAFATVAYTITQAVEPALPLSAEPCFAPTDRRFSGGLAEALHEPPYLRIDTDVFRAYVRRDSGIIVSLFDKRVNRELVGYGLRRASHYIDSARADLALNVLQLLDEDPHGMSAWNLDEVRSETSLLRGATTRVIEQGPARLVLEVEHTVRASTITQRIVFYRSLGRIDFATTVDWRERGGPEHGIPNLKVAFTARLDEAEAWFETPFAAVRRPCDGQEVPALRWADVGGASYGIALINDSKYGYDALGTRLRLSLLRSAYDPDAVSDSGIYHIRYSLLPHPGSWRDAGVVQLAAGFNQPLLARTKGDDAAGASAAHATFQPSLVGSPSVLIAAVKLAADGQGTIVRLYESTGRHGSVELAGLLEDDLVSETTIVEDALRQLPVRNGRVGLAFAPWQVRTLLVRRAQAAYP